MQISWIPLWEKAAGLSWLRSLQSAFITTFPLMFIGSLAVLLNQFPLPIYRDTMAELFGPDWTKLGGYIWNGTFAVMSAAIAFTVGVNLAAHYNNKVRTRQVSPVTVGLIAFASLFCLIVPTNGGIPQEWTGVAGLFGAVMIALLSSYLFLLLSSIRWLRMRLSVDNAEGSVVQAFSSLLPGAITIGIFGFVGLFFDLRTGTGFHNVLYGILMVGFENSFDSEILRGLFYTLSLQFLWFFGIHGANVLDPITHGLNIAAIEANMQAAAAHEALPHIITKPFLDSFVFIGGTGCTISLILALLISSRFSERRRLAGISSIFGIFNINELLVFGFPIILNPIVLIPFIFIPVILCTVAYGVVALDLVPRTSTSVGWSVPIFVNAYMVTDSIKGVLLQVFNIALATCLYIPFVRLADSIRSKELLTAISRLFDCVSNCSPVERQQRCLNREGTLGALARGLATDLEDALKRQQSGLYLVYQPQVSSTEGKVVGVEALLRWNHPKVGYISPLVTIALAEDADLIRTLGEWIIRESCKTRKVWLDMGIEDVIMSFNLSVHQITTSLPDEITDNMRRYSIPPHLLKVEVTESVSLDVVPDSTLILERIHDSGVKIAIDDFGMGHSSLMYLRKFPVSSVKIDGSITREVGVSTLSSDIVSSIVTLCRSRQIDCVVEYVETEEQVNTLLSLGCQVFQGYYFSPPLADATCAEYILGFTMPPKG